MQITQDYITALTGSPDTVMNWRVIHDTDKSQQGRNITGSLSEVYTSLQQYNTQGWGVFVCINAMDGQGHTLQNVHHVRTHVVDLDNPLSSNAMLNQALASYPAPHFMVNTSPNKYHVYWLVEPYTGNDYYTNLQRKLAQLYDGDKSICDPTRVLRVPGFNHLKSEAYPVTFTPLSNNPRIPPQVLSDSIAHVNVINHVTSRKPLGTPELAAPSIEWLQYAFSLVDPNELTRDEWMSFSAAFKQSGWTLTDDETLFQMWSTWCNQYAENNEGENRKLWNSFRDTEIGWPSIEYRSGVKPYIKFGFDNPAKLMEQARPKPSPQEPKQTTQQYDFPELLSPDECKLYFKDCVFVTSMGEIFSPSGRFMNSTKFNGAYGGKNFIISGANSKVTDEPWKAALRSSVWTIPKVDHIRFLPTHAPLEILEDQLGRKGLNTYIPITKTHKQGDVSIWLDHVSRILPVESDRKMLFDYLAHCVKYPGYKIPWAPLVQSTEGVGKTVFFEVMEHALGDMYIYRPKAPELISSGSKFNAWMRARLMIVVDEIKIDERRELIEILKPMITDDRVEIQSKGVDQQMEDNVANWLFFSNYKDAIPLHQNGRRYSIFYSAIQNKTDLLRAGMDKTYFDRLWKWLREEDGLSFIAHWLHNYPIERGAIENTAPETSSHQEALKIGRSPIEVVLDECIEENLYGFRNGYMSVATLLKYIREAGYKTPNENTLRSILEGRGYYDLGNVPQPIFNENGTRVFRVYGVDFNMLAENYANSQI